LVEVQQFKSNRRQKVGRPRLMKGDAAEVVVFLPKDHGWDAV